MKYKSAKIFKLKNKSTGNVTGKKPSVDARLRDKIAKREAYREKNNIVLTSCADNLEQLNDHAKLYTVTLPNGKVAEIKAFPITSVGGPLEITGVTVTRWVNNGMLPAPILQSSRGAVYHIDEVGSFVKIIGDHQRNFRQYRGEHEETKRKLFSANAKIRRGLFN